MQKLSYLLLLAALWGPSFLFIRLTVHEVPPLTLVAGRMLGAAVLLFGLMRLRGSRLPTDRKTWLHFAFLAFIGTAFPFVLVGWAEQHIDSAVASILNGTVPIWTLVIAHFWTQDDRLDRMKLLGVVLGLVGLVLLIAPSIQGSVRLGIIGLLAAAFSAVCYAIAGVYARKYLRGLPPLAGPTMQFLLSAIYLVPFSLIFDRPWTIQNPSATAWGSWIGLIVLGTVAAFAVYYHLLEIATASYISMVTYLMPVIGVALGVMVLDEELRWNAYAGCGAILLGVLAVNGLPGRKRAAAAAE